MTPCAEVIGDPISHSKSPAIHRFWLDALQIDGEFSSVRIPSDALAAYFEMRRRRPEWRGCNVTVPNKLAVIPFLDDLSAGAYAVGAVNCILPREGGLIGLNTDVDGIGEALAGIPIAGKKIAIIGGGGGARAAIHYCAGQGASEIGVLVRDPAKVQTLSWDQGAIRIRPLGDCEDAIADAQVVINASPLGMAHASSTPAALLASLSRVASGAVVFDMVYDPLETPFLSAARALGRHTVDGLVMLVGQARRAFAHFYGATPPRERDADLRKCLIRIQAD